MAAGDNSLLIVEDSEEDFDIVVRCLRRAGFSGNLARCTTGDGALDYLYRRAAYSDAALSPRPSMVLLDINLPGTDGRAVLAKMKSDPLLRTIPVIVLTTSRDARDIESSYQAGANSYLVKPGDIEGFASAMSRLREFWFEHAILPTV